MVPGFQLLFDCNNKVPKLKKEDTNWVPTNWADYMELDAMTTLLGDAICNIKEEEEYWEACQHELKSSYEARTSDEDEEGGESPSDDDESSDSKSDSSSDSNNNSSNNGDSEDNSNSDSESNNSENYDSQYSSNDWGESPSDREDRDVGPFYKDHFDDDVDYYDGDTEDDAEVEPIDMENDVESEENEL